MNSVSEIDRIIKVFHFPCIDHYLKVAVFFEQALQTPVKRPAAFIFSKSAWVLNLGQIRE